MRRARELSLSHYCRGQQILNSRPGDGRPNLDNWSNHAPIQRSKSLLTTRAPPATPQTRRPAQKSQQPELAVPAPPSRVWKPRLSNFLELGSSPDFTNVKSTGAWAKNPLEVAARGASGLRSASCRTPPSLPSHCPYKISPRLRTDETNTGSAPPSRSSEAAPSPG